MLVPISKNHIQPLAIVGGVMSTSTELSHVENLLFEIWLIKTFNISIEYVVHFRIILNIGFLRSQDLI